MSIFDKLFGTSNSPSDTNLSTPPAANGVRPPMPGETVPVICPVCDYRGTGKISKLNLTGNTLANKTCPKCKKKTLIKDPWFTN